MGQFTSKCEWTAVSDEKGDWDKQTIILEENFGYVTKSGFGILVPKDFVCDGLSIPWGFKWLVKPLGKGVRAGIIHDYLYSTREKSRSFADKVMKECLSDCGVNWLTRGTMWLGVRGFGWLFYLLIFSMLIFSTGCSAIIPIMMEVIGYTSTGISIYKTIDDLKSEDKADDSNTNR